jgi:hypothetical protein
MGGFIFEVQIDTDLFEFRQREWQQMRVCTSTVVGLDHIDGPVNPLRVLG